MTVSATLMGLERTCIHAGPLPARRQEIPKDGGKVRVLSIPAIRDRVVQRALKLVLEPPKRTAHEAVDRVARADAPSFWFA